VNIYNHKKRQDEIEKQNQILKNAVNERTKELSIYSNELSRSNRELEDFAFVASHDLQEPLRKIRAFGDRLSADSDMFSSKQSDYLNRMTSAASRMSSLINDLLEFSRISTRGKSFETVDVNTIIKDCIEDLNILIEETNAKIVLAEAPNLLSDKTQMRQLFSNLLGNAIKFSNKNDMPQVDIHIKQVEQPPEIKIEGLSEWYTFSVKDNGIGFEQEYAEKIFAPFQRLHSRASYKGTGIGLAICRRIVERHNGVIEAKGMPGEGALFEVTLPAVNVLTSID
jgi:light-regulated signal transduction histidine kinase (bacteriophytochrome)